MCAKDENKNRDENQRNGLLMESLGLLDAKLVVILMQP